MTPTSDQLEAFFERLRDIDRALAKIRSAELRDAQLTSEIKSVSKDWLRLSESLRSTEALPSDGLGEVDVCMRDLLQSTSTRARASAYRSKLAPILVSFTDKIVVPVIRLEGSPAQVAARQLVSEFTSKVSADEQAYLEEAARCLGSKCNRAAIILLWAAGISRLHAATEKLGFNSYNAAMDIVSQKKGSPYSRASKAHVGSLPELQRSRDFDLIVVGMELWKYDLQVFEELDRLLSIRNSAAHPGMLRPSALDVQQYASKLATYIFGTVVL